MLDDIEDVLLRADLGTAVAARIADAVGAGRYDKAISADEVKTVVASAGEGAGAGGEAAGDRRGASRSSFSWSASTARQDQTTIGKLAAN